MPFRRPIASQPYRRRSGPRTAAGLAWLAAAVVFLAGCTADEPQPYASPRSNPSTAAAPQPAATRGAPVLERPSTLATGLRTPWGLAFLPDGSALVGERDTGRIVLVPPAGGKVVEVYRVPGVVPGGEGGLLGLAVNADYARNRWVYAYLTAATDNRLVRFRLTGGVPPQVLLEGVDKAGIHNGGRIAFGPDGMLYVGTGDAGRTDAAQDPDDTNGKILRITPNGKPAPGNPHPGSPIYSIGHRNVQGLAWSADGRLFATEFGQNRLDEVNVIRPDGNYGWPQVEGTGGDDRYVDPVVTWRTSEASPSGAAVIGDTLYVAALRGARLWRVPIDGGDPSAALVGTYGRLRTVAAAPDGSLWVTTSNTDGRGDPRPGDDRILRFAPR